MSASDLELLDLQEVYAVPGVMQSGDRPFPKPFMDFRHLAPKGSSPSDHIYWRRGDILQWLQEAKAPHMTAKARVGGYLLLGLVAGFLYGLMR